MRNKGLRSRVNLAAGWQKTIAANGSQAVRQDIGQLASGELHAGECFAAFCNAVAAIFSGEGDRGMGDFKNPGIGNCRSAHIGSEILTFARSCGKNEENEGDGLRGVGAKMRRRGTPQVTLPIFPSNSTAITRELAFQEQEAMVWYFNGNLPLFHHAAEDLGSFRFFTSKLIANGLWVRAERCLSESGHQTAILSTDYRNCLK